MASFFELQQTDLKKHKEAKTKKKKKGQNKSYNSNVLAHKKIITRSSEEFLGFLLNERSLVLLRMEFQIFAPEYLIDCCVLLVL